MPTALPAVPLFYGKQCVMLGLAAAEIHHTARQQMRVDTKRTWKLSKAAPTNVTVWLFTSELPKKET